LQASVDRVLEFVCFREWGSGRKQRCWGDRDFDGGIRGAVHESAECELFNFVRVDSVGRHRCLSPPCSLSRARALSFISIRGYGMNSPALHSLQQFKRIRQQSEQLPLLQSPAGE
jgi:hypothetical protein